MYHVTMPNFESFSMIYEQFYNFIDNNSKIKGK